MLLGRVAKQTWTKTSTKALSEFFYIYFALIFEKQMVESKISRNVHLAPYPTAAGVPATVRHCVWGDANGRLHCPVGPDS
jgi:hypothetical protein